MDHLISHKPTIKVIILQFGSFFKEINTMQFEPRFLNEINHLRWWTTESHFNLKFLSLQGLCTHRLYEILIIFIQSLFLLRFWSLNTPNYKIWPSRSNSTRKGDVCCPSAVAGKKWSKVFFGFIWPLHNLQVWIMEGFHFYTLFSQPILNYKPNNKWMPWSRVIKPYHRISRNIWRFNSNPFPYSTCLIWTWDWGDPQCLVFIFTWEYIK